MSIHTQRVRRRTRAFGSPPRIQLAKNAASAVEDTLSFGSAVARTGAHVNGAGITSIPHSAHRVKTVNAVSALAFTDLACRVAAGRITGFGFTETLRNAPATKRAHMGGTATNRNRRG